MIRAAAAVVVLAALAGCAPATPRAVRAPTIASWRRGLDRLAALRAAASRPRTTKIALDLVEPRSGRKLSARGAVAIAPPSSLRMILLGPGGTTALDLWLRGDHFRFAVPAIDLKRRGDLTAPRAERRGLPVDFLSWWLLRPAGGSVLWHEEIAGGDRFVLRDGGAIIDMTVSSEGYVVARRTTWIDGARADVETIAADAVGCATVRYHQGSTGLDVTVRCEGEAMGDPPPRALADPDAEDGS